MALSPVDVAQGAGEVLGNIFRAAPGLAADAAALYVKEGTPPSLIPNVGVALARQACRRYGDNPDGLPGSVAAGFERVCRPYLDDIGYGEAPGIAKPFDGGQCVAKYVVSYEFDTSGSTSGTLLAIGPIGGLREEDGPFGSKRVYIRANSGVVFGGECFNVLNPSGSQETLLGSYTPPPGEGGTARIVNISPCAADNCGSPPPVIIRPVPPPAPGPRVEPYNPSPDIDIDIDIEIGPTGIIVFDIGVGPIEIDPFGDDDGGGGDDGGGAPGSGLPPGDIGSPGAPADTGEGGVASGCAPENSVLVGIKINILEPLPQVSEYDPLVRRGVCYAYMGTIGNLALNPEGVALRNGQMLFAPLDNLTCYEVRANVGYQLRITPYYRALEPEEV